ncbi:PKD domain-containing protein [uncultured Aquimarina sp.]|uniref:PKD domain-containing protein n=1 Tax=uncultured Aquimarina sp. TaxID=575652 RepID=UPI0026184A3B|nr:PKD domain-containing protein [uncultured Aquimarina sp.]
MKNLLLLVSIAILTFSCSSDEETAIQLPIACFSIDKEVVEVGEEFVITDCSENATEITFSYTNNEEEKTTTESSFTLSFSSPGTQTIQLTVSNENETETIYKRISVLQPRTRYKFFDYPNGTRGFPIASGINSENNNLFMIEIIDDILDNSLGKIFYREIDNNNEIIESLYIGDQTDNTGNCFRFNKLNGELVFTFVNTLGNYYSSREIILDQSGSLVKNGRSDLTVSYNNIKVGDEFAFFGSNRVSVDTEFKLAPAIQIRDVNNNVIKTMNYPSMEENAFIGDLTKTSEGYIGYGGTFTSENDILENYEPVLFLLNENFELIKNIRYTSQLTSSVTSINDLNGSFHIEELSSGNFACYSHNELRVVAPDGNEIMSKLTRGSSGINDLLNLNDSFIVTENRFLTKYDHQGNELKSIQYGGQFISGLIQKNNIIYFIAAESSSDLVENLGNISLLKGFMGAVNDNLQIVDINNN